VTDVNTVNTTAAALLGLLHGGPMTGGQLVAAAADRYGTFFSVTRSQVYRELPGLAEAGLLRLGARGPRASQQYVLTPAGRRAFKAWLVSGDGTEQLRSPLILRVLYAGSLTVRQRRTLVQRGREAYAERLVRAEESAKYADSSPSATPYARAVAEFAVAHNRAVLALLDTLPAD
jgi:DNA-binding PadR family transcriptional regulator